MRTAPTGRTHGRTDQHSRTSDHPCQRGAVHTWRQASFPPDLHTEVEARFEPVGQETRVSIEHRGFTRVPAESAARHGFPDQALQMRLGEWWRAQLASLDDHAAQA
ncbi:MAG: SRPBCC domain-containing protein [Phenylobacterium sp.]|nr:SRPBCC domain-containing protein [Phenylobacterium sp.]